jgi:hypothetical protein
MVREQLAVLDHQRRIEYPRPVVFGIPDDHRDAGHLAPQPLDGTPDLGAHARMEQQILGRITGHRELGEHHDVSAVFIARRRGRRDDPRGIAVDIADHQVDLRHDTAHAPWNAHALPCKFMICPGVPISSHRGGLF